VRAKHTEEGPLLAGDLAKAAGVSTDTLRHYERKGVLQRPRRAANGYRQYPREARERVFLVRHALAVGFTLDELARVLSVRDSGAAPCKEVCSLAAAKLAEIEERLARMIELRDGLRATLKNWDARLAGIKDGGRAESEQQKENCQPANEVVMTAEPYFCLLVLHPR